MSLDLTLYTLVDLGGPEPHYVSLHDMNVTHNLGLMAVEAGIYDYLWHPERVRLRWAKQLIEPLTLAIKRMESKPEHYDLFAPANGWGTRGNFVQALEALREACIKFPKAKIGVSR